MLDAIYYNHRKETFKSARCPLEIPPGSKKSITPDSSNKLLHVTQEFVPIMSDKLFPPAPITSASPPRTPAPGANPIGQTSPSNNFLFPACQRSAPVSVYTLISIITALNFVM